MDRIRLGDIIELTHSGQIYIVAVHSGGKIQLTNLKSGKRWAVPVKVIDIHFISETEEQAILSGNGFTYLRRCTE